MDGAAKGERNKKNRGSYEGRKRNGKDKDEEQGFHMS